MLFFAEHKCLFSTFFVKLSGQINLLHLIRERIRFNIRHILIESKSLSFNISIAFLVQNPFLLTVNTCHLFPTADTAQL